MHDERCTSKQESRESGAESRDSNYNFNQCISIITGSQFELHIKYNMHFWHRNELTVNNSKCLSLVAKLQCCCCCWLFLSYIRSKYLRCCIQLENGSMHPIPTMNVGCVHFSNCVFVVENGQKRIMYKNKI